MASYVAQSIQMAGESVGMASHHPCVVPVIIAALKYATQWQAAEATTPLASEKKGERYGETRR